MLDVASDTTDTRSPRCESSCNIPTTAILVCTVLLQRQPCQLRDLREKVPTSSRQDTARITACCAGDADAAAAQKVAGVLLNLA